MPAFPYSPRSRFGIRFAVVSRRWRRTIEALLAATGLTDASWALLIHLRETGGGIAQKDLGTLAGVEGANLVRMLDFLYGEGLIERRADPSDGRARLIHLTEAGMLRAAEIRQAVAKEEETLLVDLSDAELAAMIGLLQRIEARLEEPSRSAGR